MQAPPDFSLMKEYFEGRDEAEVVSRLQEVKASQFYIQSNYLALIRQHHEEQQLKSFIHTCKEASNIAEHGRNLEKAVNGKKTIRGVQDAVGFFYDRMSEFLRVESGEKLEGSIAEEASEVIDEYETTEKNKKFADRNLFGLEPVDAVCKGHKRGEYWIHCAFSGELKSTTALNYAYNNAYVYQRNIFYAMLEMQYKSVRRQLYVIHSSHGKFVTEWAEEDRKAGREEIYTGIHYRKVRDGELTELEKKRFKLVAQDFEANCKGKIYIWRPEEEASMQDIKRKSEIFHNKHRCDGLIVDYLGLVKSTQRSTETVDRLNRVVTEGRLLALNFARGTGVPILALFQMNRQGKLRADKNEGKYDFAAISYANQCLSANTMVTTSVGQVQIADIIPGFHQVWSATGWKPVLNKFDNGIQEVWDLGTDGGHVVRATPGHRFRTMTSDGNLGWTELRDLKVGDSVLVKNQNTSDTAEMFRQPHSNYRPERISSITPQEIHERVYDLEVTGDHEYETAGFFSHNCEKDADVITYTYLNDLLRKEGKYYLGCIKNRDNPHFEQMIGKIIWHSKRMRAIEPNALSLDSDDKLLRAAEDVMRPEMIIT